MGSRIGREQVGLLPRLRALASRGDRFARGPCDGRGATGHGRRGGVGVDRRTCRGSFDHLILATSLPAFLAAGIHHLEAWNEAVCDGDWGASRASRRAAPAGRRPRALGGVPASIRDLTELLRSISRADEPPATITILSGDVHTSYVATVDLGADAGTSRVHQVVCSPFRNPLNQAERRIVKLTGSRPAAFGFSALARACGVRPPVATWTISSRRTFHNSIGELALDRHRAHVTLFRSRPGSEQGDSAGLVRIYDADLGDSRRAADAASLASRRRAGSGRARTGGGRGARRAGARGAGASAGRLPAPRAAARAAVGRQSVVDERRAGRRRPASSGSSRCSAHSRRRVARASAGSLTTTFTSVSLKSECSLRFAEPSVSQRSSTMPIFAWT